MIHSILGVAHRNLSDYESAISELQKSLSFRRAAENDRGVTATCTNLAVIYAELGRVREARELLQEGLAIAKSTDNATMESFALLILGGVNQGAGDLQEALANYSASLEIEWERNEHTELADRLNAIGSVYSQLGRYADATVYLEQARLHIEKANLPAVRGYNLLVTAQIHQAKGKYAAAIEEFLSSIPLLRETGQPREVATANEQLAEIYVQQGRDEDALGAVEQSLATNEQFRVPIRLAESTIHEALYLLAMGRTSAAEQAVRKAEDHLGELKGGHVLVLLHLAKRKNSTRFGCSPYIDEGLRSSSRPRASKRLSAFGAKGALGALTYDDGEWRFRSGGGGANGRHQGIQTKTPASPRGRSLPGTRRKLPSIVGFGASRGGDCESCISRFGVSWGAHSRRGRKFAGSDRPEASRR